MNFSKSKYVEYMGCPKAAWLSAHKSEERRYDSLAHYAFEDGAKVGELAKGYFGAYVDMTTYKADGSLDLVAMAQKTKRAIADGKQNICEAAFIYDGNYCAVDILHKSERDGIDGYEICEVKSSSKMKDYYYYDVAYQENVVRSSGINVLGVRLLHVDKQYVLQGKLDVKQLLIAKDIDETQAKYAGKVKEVPINLAKAEKILQGEEFDCCGKQCNGNWCGYYAYCMRNEPKPSVLELYNCKKRWDYFQDGIKSFEDILNSGIQLDNDIQRRQVEFALRDKGTYVDKVEIKAFLDRLTYPLYFLDFETMQLAIPEFDGTRPYANIPFQYSLHYIERENGELKHKEYLAPAGVDPRRELAERLSEDIPQDVCVLAYHASTEKGIIETLAQTFPDLSERLLNIRACIKDLLPIFQDGYYYKREMGGSFSIKSVLPAVFPNLDYHNLVGVNNGGDAMHIFPRINDMSPNDAEEARKQLLEYCELDTFAMVKLWQELIRVSR